MEGGLSRANDLRIGKGWWLRVLSSLVVLFLLSPLLLLMFFSFNASRNITSWSGFTLDWYAVAFSDRALWIAVRNSLIIAVASTAASTVLGTLAALALGKYSFRGRALFQSLLHVPIIIPEIIFGISLLALFVFIRMPLGIVSIICAHITFSISFVTLIVLAKVRNFDRNLENACLDLGATRLQAFFHVVLPAISPGIIAGALFAFTLSLDDFVVTFFTAGPGSSTLPLKIYSLIKFGITPAVNAVSTILIVLTASTIIAATLIQTGAQTSRAIRLFSYVLLGVIGIALCAFTLFSPREERVVRLYIFAEYIDQSILTDFQKTYGVKVTQDYTNSNEELLSKLQMGATGYDIIVPTGFMVQIMIREGLIAPLNPRNIPNLEHIDPTFRKLWYDPDGRYSVPYAYGFTGFVYNSSVVTDPVDSWNVMWDERYAGKLLMVDDMREVFAVSYIRLGYPPTDTDPSHLRQALELLMRQKPLLRKYEANLINDLLINGDALIAQDWSGNAFRLNQEHPEFKFVLPKEGCMMFIDNMCIPKKSTHKEEAELFLNFLLRPDVSARNMRKILYAMPNPDARRLLDENLRRDTILFPPVDDLSRYRITHDIGEFTIEMERAWTELRGT